MMRKQLRVGLWICAALVIGSFRAEAAMDMFLKLAGVEGESVDARHAKEIDVLAWSWGMSNPGSSTGGAGKVNVQDLSLTKWVDKASPKLMLGVCNGQHFDSAVLTVRRSGATPFEFLKISLTDVIVTSASTGGSGGEDRLMENVTLSFRTVKVDYLTQNPDGTTGPVVSFGWDLGANASL